MCSVNYIFMTRNIQNCSLAFLVMFKNMKLHVYYPTRVFSIVTVTFSTYLPNDRKIYWEQIMVSAHLPFAFRDTRTARLSTLYGKDIFSDWVCGNVVMVTVSLTHITIFHRCQKLF